MVDIKDLEKDYYDLSKPPILSDTEFTDEKLQVFEEEYYHLAKSPIFSHVEIVDDKPKVKEIKAESYPGISAGERIHWLESRIHEFERTLALINENLTGHRKRIDERLGKLESRERIPPEVRNELSSLKSLVEKTMNVSEEIKTKTPQMLRELEGKVNNFNEKVGFLDSELKKVKEETKKDYWTRPVIIE